MTSHKRLSDHPTPIGVKPETQLRATHPSLLTSEGDWQPINCLENWVNEKQNYPSCGHLLYALRRWGIE